MIRSHNYKSTYTIQRVIFEGENFHEVHELSLIRENFPCEIAEVSVAVLVTAMHS